MEDLQRAYMILMERKAQEHHKMFELLKLIAVFGTDEYASQALQLVQEINKENKP